MVRLNVSQCPIIGISAHSAKWNSLKSNSEVSPDFIRQGVEIRGRWRLFHLVILHQH